MVTVKEVHLELVGHRGEKGLREAAYSQEELAAANAKDELREKLRKQKLGEQEKEEKSRAQHGEVKEAVADEKMAEFARRMSMQIEAQEKEEHKHGKHLMSVYEVSIRVEIQNLKEYIIERCMPEFLKLKNVGHKKYQIYLPFKVNFAQGAIAAPIDMNVVDHKGPFIDDSGQEQLTWNVRVDDVMVMTKFLDVMDNLELGYNKYWDNMAGETDAGLLGAILGYEQEGADGTETAEEK